MNNPIQNSSSPIHVVHVLATLNRGGAETLVLNLYRSIDRTCVQFDFVTHYRTKAGFVDEVKRMVGRIFVCPTFSLKNICGYINWWKKFFKDHPEFQILHSHVRSTASFYLPIARKYGLKTIIHSHSTNNGRGITGIVKSLLQYPLRWQADYYMACSKISGEWLFGNKIVNSERFVVIQNGINVDKFRFDAIKRQKMRDDLKLGNSRVFIHVGGLRAVKNHTFLLDVFEKVHQKDLNTKLLLVGKGELEREMKNKIHHLNLEDSVMMLGTRGDVAELLQAADCFLLPSIWEGVPTSVIEAQASGIPCIISNKVNKDVAISPLVTLLPIDEGVLPWVREIEKMAFIRRDVLDDIRNKGYDINQIAHKIVELYWSTL